MSEKKSFLGKAIDDMKESAKLQHEIDKENYEAIKADSKARIEEAKKVDPDFQEFKDAKGLKAKAKVIGDHVSRDSKKISEENREKHKKMLEEQRKHINELTGMNNATEDKE